MSVWPLHQASRSYECHSFLNQYGGCARTAHITLPLSGYWCLSWVDAAWLRKTWCKVYDVVGKRNCWMRWGRGHFYKVLCIYATSQLHRQTVTRSKSVRCKVRCMCYKKVETYRPLSKVLLPFVMANPHSLGNRPVFLPDLIWVYFFCQDDSN